MKIIIKKRKLDEEMAANMLKIRKLDFWDAKERKEIEKLHKEFMGYCKKDGIEPVRSIDIAAEIDRIIEEADKNNENLGIIKEEYGHDHKPVNVRYINFRELKEKIKLDICEDGLKLLVRDLVDDGYTLSIDYSKKCDNSGYICYFRINDTDANNTRGIKEYRKLFEE